MIKPINHVSADSHQSSTFLLHINGLVSCWISTSHYKTINCCREEERGRRRGGDDDDRRGGGGGGGEGEEQGEVFITTPLSLETEDEEQVRQSRPPS